MDRQSIPGPGLPTPKCLYDGLLVDRRRQGQDRTSIFDTPPFKDADLPHQLRMLETAYRNSVLSIREMNASFPTYVDLPPLFKAVFLNDMEFIEEYFSNSTADPDVKMTGKEWGVNLLTFACHTIDNASDSEFKERRLETVRFLIDRGANVNGLCSASRKHYLKCESVTPIYVAVNKRNEELVQLLLQKGADPSIELNPYKLTPLHFAAFNNQSDVCEMLLRSGADINRRDIDGNTPLIIACTAGHCDVAYVILKWSGSTGRRADINLSNKTRKMTALHAAVVAGCLEAVDLLLLFGADVNARTVEGHTPLDMAIFMEQSEIKKSLTEQGATSIMDPKQRQSYLVPAYGCPSPLGTSSFGFLEDMKYLIRRGDDVNTRDAFGQTPLFQAVCAGSVKAVSLLIEANALINVESIHGHTPLHLAIYLGFERIVSTLLQKGAKIDYSCSIKPLLVTAAELPSTPLLLDHVGVGILKKSRAKIARQLIMEGCPFDDNYNDLPPLEYAVRCGNDGVATVIRQQVHLFRCIQKQNLAELRKCLKSGVILACRSVLFGTPIEYAVSQNNFDVVSSLIEHGANANYTRSGDVSALHIAAKDNRHAIARKLLASGAAFDLRTIKSGKTPLEVCQESNPNGCETAELLNFVQTIFDLGNLKDFATVNEMRNVIVKARNSRGQSVDDIFRKAKPGNGA